MNKTCDLGTYKQFKCIGHGLHNLVIKDGFAKTDVIHQLLKNVRAIVKALRYRACEFERLSKDEESLMLEMSELSEEFLLFDDDENYDDEDEDDVYYEIGPGFDENLNKKSYKTLKLDVKTRWHSAVPMIESILGSNRSVVKVMLQKAEHPELALTTAEYSLLKELLDFLKNFQVITAIFSGDKYATANYYVLFGQEVHSLLECEPHDSMEIKELKTNMLGNFHHRFPQSDSTILASLLDPRFQNLLDVKNYLKSAGCTSVEFLMKQSKKVLDTHSSINKDTQNPDNANIQKNKSYITEMAERHSTLASLVRSTSISEQTDLQRECFMLLSMGGVTEVTDILTFWKNNSKLMPMLSEVAAATYCVPATSTPSERNFSTSGKVLDSKKSQTSPENLDKILFIHNNYEFFKNNCPSIVT